MCTTREKKVRRARQCENGEGKEGGKEKENIRLLLLSYFFLWGGGKGEKGRCTSAQRGGKKREKHTTVFVCTSIDSRCKAKKKTKKKTPQTKITQTGKRQKGEKEKGRRSFHYHFSLVGPGERKEKRGKECTHDSHSPASLLRVPKGGEKKRRIKKKPASFGPLARKTRRGEKRHLSDIQVISSACK